MKTRSLSNYTQTYLSKIILLLIVALLSAGCAGSPQTSPTLPPSDTPAPTNTPVPTDTSVPTDTPMPTDTPTATPTETLVPTETPDLAATRAVESTATSVAILVPIKAQLEEVGIPTDTGSLVWLQDEPFPFRVDTPGPKYVEGLEDGPSVANFVFSTEVTWEATGIVICGVIFRSEADLIEGDQYNFQFLRFSGLPAWDIEFFKDGYFKNNITGDIRFSDAINLDNGSTNRILLIVEGEKFTVYINGVRQGNFFDYSKQRLDGEFGFTASEDSGTSTCTFANTWIWELP